MRVNEVVTQAILAGRGGRVMVSMPPQNGKSTLVSELLPAWFLGRHPDKQVAMVSYEADFAATFGRKARDRLEQQGHLFGVSVDQSSRAANHWAIKGRRGAMFTSGVGGPLTGKSAHLLIIDDPIKNSEEAASETIRKKHQEWYRSTAYSRIQPDTVIVVVMCMVGDTPVLMADGTEKPLKDVRPGNHVATHDAGRVAAARVVNWANQGYDTTYEIRTTSGRSVRANARHPFLVSGGGEVRWIRLSELKAGDEIVSLTQNVGRGPELNASTPNAISRQGQGGYAHRTTTKQCGPPDTDRRQLIQSRGATPALSIATASSPASTRDSLSRRAADAQSAERSPAKTCWLTGAESCALTIAMALERSERCYATTAILSSATGKRSSDCSEPLSTFGITLDRIESISEYGIEEVFDVQIEGTENFIANGLVSHNTRWHEDDLCGWLLQEEATGGDKWEKLVFPAICESENDALGRKIGEPLWPERYSAAMLAQIRRTQGPYWWAGMYQQRPAPLEGGLFKREYFQLVDQAPLHHKVLARIRSWDFGGTTEGDYSVGVLMSLTDDGRYYVEHIIRGQWEPGVRDRIIRQVAETDGQDCMINLEQEPGSGGLSQVKYLRLKLGGYPVFVDKPTGDPLLRAKPLASSGESGIIHLVKGEWIRAYLDEMMVFPNGSHDDQVMASCYAFNRLASSGMYEIDTPHSFDRPKADPERYGIRMVRPENNPREHRR